MGRKKHKKGSKSKNAKHGELHGITDETKGQLRRSVEQGGLMLLAAIAAGGVGAVLGRHSFVAGIPVAIGGLYLDNKYMTAAGIGLAMSNGFQSKSTSTTTKSMNGFDLKQVAQDAKDRVAQYFDNFKEKLYIPATPAESSATSSSTDGLGKSQEAQYFINPYSTKDLDLSAMDRVEQHVAAMNQVTGSRSGTGTNGFEDIDREF